MNKKAAVTILASLILLALLAALFSGCRKTGADEEPRETYWLEATVLEVSGKSLLVAPVEGSREQADRILVGAPREGGDAYLSSAVPGMKVWIGYDGMLAETYPPQILSPYSVLTEKTASLFPGTYREVIERDDLVIQGNGGLLLNLDLWEDFRDAVGRGEEAEVTVVQFTVEGDPIYLFLRFKDGRYHLLSDSTYDTWGYGTVEKYYHYFEQLKVGGIVYYILADRAFGSDEAFADFLSGTGEYPDMDIQIILTVPE